MTRLLRILLMVALTVVTVSTAQHAQASEQADGHAAHAGHAHNGAPAHEPVSDHDPMTCCPSLSNLCGTGAVLCQEVWSPVGRTTAVISLSPQDRAALLSTSLESEPPPPRA